MNQLAQLPLFAGRDRWVRRFPVASSSDPDTSYTVATDAAGRWGCSCPAWVHDPLRKPCKHIVAFRQGELGREGFPKHLTGAAAAGAPR